MSSTPPRASSSQAVFSDTVRGGRSSPPSSPPDSFPWERKRDTPSTSTSTSANTEQPTVGPFKNVFSILGKKRKPLATASNNARPAKTSKTAPRDGLQQMQISLGQKVQKKCDTCGMEYVASSAEDRKLHDKYHKQSVDGIDVGKDFVTKVSKDGRESSVFQGVKEGDAVVFLDCWCNHHRRKKGQAVLEIVERELGAVAIPQQDIWDLKHPGNDSGNFDAKYKTFLYVRGTKCVGYLLVQRIEEALEVVKPQEPATTHKQEAPPLREADDKKLSALEKLRARKQHELEAANTVRDEMAEAANHPLQLSEAKHPAVMGVARIWTSSSHRGQGIAPCLLNTAINRHNSIAARGQKEKAQLLARGDERGDKLADLMGTPPPKIERKQDVAFSQPTEAGTKLARKWFGRAYGWRVYSD